MVIEILDDLYKSFIYVESSGEGLQTINCFLEINEIVEQVPLVLQIYHDDDPTVEDLFHCVPFVSITGLAL